MDSDSSTEPPTAMYQIETWFKMIPYHEYWSFLVLAGIVLLMSAWGRRRFLINAGIVSSLLGLAHVIFPGQLIGVWITGSMDPVHIELDRIAGMVILLTATYCYFLSSSTDSTVEATLLLGFIIVPGLQFMNIVHTFSSPGKKKSLTISQQGLCLGMLSHTLMVAAALFYYVTMKDRGGYGEHPSRRNFHLRLNFLSFFLIGVLMYAFPAAGIKFLTSTKNVDVVHAFLARICGAAFIGHGIVAALATNFLRETDKISVLICHVAGLALQTSSLLCSALMYSEFRSLGMVVILGTKLVLLVNSMLGAEFGSVCKQCHMGDSLKSVFTYVKTLGKPAEKTQ